MSLIALMLVTSSCGSGSTEDAGIGAVDDDQTEQTGAAASEDQNLGAVDGDETGQIGEVVGIRHYYYLDESGTVSQDGTYGSSVAVLLQDGSDAVAYCPRDCLLEVGDFSDSFFDVDPTWTPPSFVIVSDLDEPKEAVLAQTDSPQTGPIGEQLTFEWEVVEILE